MVGEEVCEFFIILFQENDREWNIDNTWPKEFV